MLKQECERLERRVNESYMARYTIGEWESIDWEDVFEDSEKTFEAVKEMRLEFCDDELYILSREMRRRGSRIC